MEGIVLLEEGIETGNKLLIRHLHDMFEISKLQRPYNADVVVPKGQDAQDIGVMEDLISEGVLFGSQTIHGQRTGYCLLPIAPPVSRNACQFFHFRPVSIASHQQLGADGALLQCHLALRVIFVGNCLYLVLNEVHLARSFGLLQVLQQGGNQLVIFNDACGFLLPLDEASGLLTQYLYVLHMAHLSYPLQRSDSIQILQSGGVDGEYALIGQLMGSGEHFGQFAVNECDGGDEWGSGEAVGEGEPNWSSPQDADLVRDA